MDVSCTRGRDSVCVCKRKFGVVSNPHVSSLLVFILPFPWLREANFRQSCWNTGEHPAAAESTQLVLALTDSLACPGVAHSDITGIIVLFVLSFL